MKKTKKNFSIFLIFVYVISALSLCFSTLLVAVKDNDKITYATNNPYVISVSSQDNSDPHGGSNYKTYIESDKIVDEDIVVRVRTKNMSAIDGVDYVGFDKEITIKKGTDETLISGTMHNTKYAVDWKYFNTFAIEIYEVVKGNAVISTTKGTGVIKISPGFEKNYTTNGDHFSAYDKIDNHIFQPGNSKMTIKGGYTNIVDFSSYHKTDFIDTGLATYYACGRVWLDEHWYETDDTPIYIALYDAYMSGNSWYTGEKMYSCGFYDLDEANITFATHYGGDDVTTKDEYINYDKSMKLNTYIHWGTYYDVRWWNFEHGSIGVSISQNAKLDRWLQDWLFFYCIRDIKQPKITGWYTDKQLAIEGSPLRISVRFAEPVQVKNQNVSVSATLTGTGSFRNKQVSFDYAGGSGTDTLYFDYYPDGTGSISNMSINGIKNSTNITDYGVNTNGENNKCPDLSTDANLRSNGVRPIDLGSDLTCTFDNSLPTLNYESTTVDKTAKKHIVSVSASGTELQGVRYVWSDKQKLEKDEITLVANEKSFSLIKDGLTGTYYLHLLAQSHYSPDTFALSVVGPFYFDNSPPSIAYLENTIGAGSHEKDIKFKVTDDKGVQNVIMYYSLQQPFSSDAVIKKALVYGDIFEEEQKEDVIFYGEEATAKLNSTLVDDEISFHIDPVLHLELDEEVGYSDYYIGFKATDILGNETSVMWFENIVNFDIRNTFVPITTINNNPADEEAMYVIDNAYVIDISSGNSTIAFTRQGNALNFDIDTVVKYEGSRRINIKEEFGMYFPNFAQTNDPGKSDTISFETKEVGYYELTLLAETEDETTYSNVIKLYVTEGTNSAKTYNYSTIYEGNGLNYKTGTFMLGNGRYFYRTSSGMGALANAYYNNSEKPLIFSSKEKATEYVQMMEYLDLYAVKLTLNDVNSMNNGALNIASGETMIPTVGQVWIRYKSLTWDYSSSQRDWAYYFYGDSTTIELSRLSQNLLRAITDVTQIIIEKGQYFWLTNIDGLNENGVPYIDPIRIPNTEHFTQTKNGSSIDFTYYHDDNMFYDSINSNSEINIGTWYEFIFRNPTKILYAEYNPELDYTDDSNYIDKFQKLQGTRLNEFVKSGTYVVRELDDKGMRDYLLFVDGKTPSVVVQFVNLNDELVNSENVDESKNGIIYYTKEFSIKQFIDDADNYSHVDVFDIRKENKVFYKSFDLTEFKTSSDYVNGCGLAKPGVYQIDVYDRSGNNFSFFVSVADSELDLNIISIKDDKLIVSLINRIVEDIDEFTVKFNGEVILEDFASMCEKTGNTYSITFYESGLYQFEVTDAFGYSITRNVELVRVNPSENVLWFTRSEENYEALDPEAISLFSTNTYYIKCDDQLTFVLDYPSIYSYEFGGSVSYNAHEGEDGKLYVDISSSEKWSVKIYYTRFPDIYVSYNRIGDNVVAPAAISVRAEDGYMDGNGIAQPNVNNEIVLYVYTDSEIVKDIKVSVKTKDMTAISALGDYQSYENTVTLTREKPEAKIVIQTTPGGYSVFDEKSGRYFTRTFEFMITNIEGNGEIGDNGVMECAIAGTAELTAVTKSNIKYFAEYLNGYNQNMSPIDLDTKNSTTDASKANNPYNETRYYSVDPSWYSTYIETGLADIYTTVGFNLEGDDSSSATDIVMKLSDSNGTQLFKVGLNGLDEDDSNKCQLGTTYSSARVKQAEEYDKKSSIKTTAQRGNVPTGTYMLVDSSSPIGNLSFNVTESSYRYYVPGGQYSPGYYAYAWPTRFVNNLYGYSIVVDTKAPEITGWYLNHDTIKINDRLRLSVRFSEPVYISGKLPYISARVNGTTTVFNFEYVGGAGTDTLYFEFAPELYENEVNITSIGIQSVWYQDSIHDYSYNVSGENNSLGSVTPPSNGEYDFSCFVDSRTPIIESNYTIPDRIIRSASVPIAVSKISAGGLVEYAWTTEEENPANFTNSQDVLSSGQNFYLQSDEKSGMYYLHIRVTSIYGKIATKNFGPFLFDSQPPIIKDLVVEEASKSLMERQVSFTIEDHPLGSAGAGIDKVYMIYSTYGEEDLVIKTIYNSEADVNQYTIDLNGKMSFLLHYYDLGLEREQQKDFNLGFYASDKLGNTISFTNYIFYNGPVCFDARSMIDVNVTTDDDYEIFNANGISVYDSSYGLKLNFEFLRYADEYDIYEFYIAGNLIDPDDYDDYFTYVTDGKGVIVSILPNVSGYFSFKLKATSGEEQNKTTQYTDNFNFYFTIGVNNSETNNYLAIQDGTLLVNKIYYLGDTKYYYHDGISIKSINYNDSNLLQAFSSKEKAYDYIYFNELLDLYAFEIPTQAVATSLNNGDGSYRKAEDDSKRVAEIGQVWIRYKRPTWDNATSTDAWVYYYYGNSKDLILSALPASLQTALAQVSNTIVSKGKYAYLTSYEGLDSNYSPTLNEKQIHFKDETALTTKAGSTYKASIKFEGDYDIFNSKVTPAGYDECSVITSYRFNFGPFTKLYYARDYGRLATASEYIELPENYTFSNVNIESGVYWLREIDENGMRDFRVYIDKTAPTLNVVYTNSKGVTNSIKVDSSVNGLVINGRSFALVNIGAEEVDTMAYVAVFRKNGVLYSVYRVEDFKQGKIEIPEGQWYLEICDRSGNIYQVVVRLNTTAMVCKVIGEENKFMRVTCNRDATDIAIYEIYLDGELVESNYSSNMSFYGAGLYTIRIEDWYGNVFTYEYELKRTLPIIEWSYEDGDSFVAYDGTQNCLTITKTSEKEYHITTNRRLQFAYLSANEYEYEFTDKDLQLQKSDFNGKTRVKINSDTSWTVKIYYAKYPNIYVVYRCIIDTDAPAISVESRQELMSLYDEREVNALNDGILTNEDADLYTPNTVRFGLSKILTRTVNNNSTIFSNLITAKFTDNSICNNVKVYLDGELINEYSNSSGVEDITFSRFGSYKIVASDMLGNESIFNFKNVKPTTFNFIVDGNDVEAKALPLPYLSDDEGNELTYPIDKYGNSYMVVGYNENSDIAFLITKEDKTYYARFEVSNGVISNVTYRLVRMENSETSEDVYSYQKVSNAILDITTLTLSSNIEENRFRIAESKDVGLNVYAQVDENQNVLFYVEAPKDSEVTVEARCIFDTNYQPYYVKVVLSGKKPSVSLTTTSSEGVTKQIEENDTSKIIYLSGTFYVNRKDLETNNISKIQIAYSKTTEFDNYITIYENREYKKVDFDEEGFYSIIVENLYGTSSKYTAILSNTLNVVLKSIYKDGKEYQYSTNYDKLIKTNEKIEIFVYTGNIDVELTFNGKVTTSEVSSVDGYCLLKYNEQGNYKVNITDAFGNVVDYSFEINTKEFEFKEEYLYGYNEKALRRDDGYTNYKLSLNGDLLLGDDICYISVVYNNEETILLDLIAEEKLVASDSTFTNSIGNFGDGEYMIVIKNSYGDIVTKTIHYRETPTLSVSRLIRTSNIPENLEFTDGNNKLYSNYNITFETISSIFDVKVDNSRVDMPLTLTFPSDRDDFGEYVQNVTYLDEYGFEYSFEVNLIRKKLNIDFSKTMNIVEIDDLNMTKDKVSLEFEEGATCTYSVNGSDPIPYLSKQILSSDGTYRFYLTDIAGNISTATVKKDTITEYAFTYAGSDRKVENGSIINSGRVQFSAVNKDSVKLKMILLNGEPYKDVSVTGFSEMGKWEFIIEDNIGNTAYFSFYIITHSLSKFEYTTPYTFKVVEITLDNGDGLPVSYLNNVLQYEYYSTIDFKDSGNYVVRATSNATSAVLNFTITIDKTPPKITLDGVNEGETTTKNVEIKGYEIGDTVEIYKDGKLSQTVHIVSNSTSVPKITTKGDYKVVVTNEAGNSVEFNFRRQYTANGATTLFILATLIIFATGLFVGLVSRKRLKV